MSRPDFGRGLGIKSVKKSYCLVLPRGCGVKWPRLRFLGASSKGPEVLAPQGQGPTVEPSVAPGAQSAPAPRSFPAVA